MGDIGNLLAGIGTMLAALVSAATLAWAMRASSRRERTGTATSAAGELGKAIADGKLDPDEVAKIVAALRDEQEPQ